jgi:hypothetical protein
MAPTAPAPAVVTPAPAVHRWSIGVGIGGMGLAPKHNPEAKADFAIAELAIRYQVGRHLQLELGGAGGRQQLEDGSEGSLAVGTIMLAARYRFRPEQAWNWWLMGGLGGIIVARHDASDEELDHARRPAGTLGIGLERRFNRFAIQAEARGIAAAETEQEREAMDLPVRGGVPVMSNNPPYAGGLFTLGASYYF